MNIGKLRLNGYFDRIIIDGYTMPFYNSKGVIINNNDSIENIINDNLNCYEQGIEKLRITIYGEADFNIADEQLLNMRFHREQNLGLTRIKIFNKDRYAIAYADIFVLKSEYMLKAHNSNDRALSEMLTATKSADEYVLLEEAVNILLKDCNKNDYSKCNVAIVDKVYVDKSFRGCEISSWLHDNIKQIVKIYGMLDISAALLLPGDFSCEARLFNMSTQQYKSFLINHYKNHGYELLNKHKGVMVKKLLK